MVDYSKWKDIEISDDEDMTHPNIHTPSLFQWRHKARIEKMEAFQKEKEVVEKNKKEAQEKLNKKQLDIEAAEKDGQDLTDLKAELQALGKDLEKAMKDEDDIREKEKKMPWNVDTISRPKFSKSVINTPTKKQQIELTDEEREQRLREFIQKNEKQMEHFGMLRKYADSKAYLMENPHLACDELANYLVFWSINLEMEGKHELMAHVAHQVICVQYILELAKQLDRDPRACISSFFARMQQPDPEYKKIFNSEVDAFKDRIRKRAKDKLDNLIQEAEEEERQKRLGPGGLDPIEVLESLPYELRECFEKEDKLLLQETIEKMDKEDPNKASYYMKLCVDSGLWIPNLAKEDEEDQPDGSATAQAEEA